MKSSEKSLKVGSRNIRTYVIKVLQYKMFDRSHNTNIIFHDYLI